MADLSKSTLEKATAPATKLLWRTAPYRDYEAFDLIMSEHDTAEEALAAIPAARRQLLSQAWTVDDVDGGVWFVSTRQPPAANSDARTDSSEGADRVIGKP